MRSRIGARALRVAVSGVGRRQGVAAETPAIPSGVGVAAPAPFSRTQQKGFVMDKYTASNGVTVEVQGISGKLRIFDDSVLPVTIDPVEADALREFYQAERDEELGRWRWPENPDYVVYHARNVNGDHKVIRETDGSGMLWGRDMEPAPASSDGLESAARAFFDAHPESKPWHDAKPGEVWLLTVDGAEEPLRTIYDGRCVRFYPLDVNGSAMTYGTRSSGITAGRRIWPESD